MLINYKFAWADSEQWPWSKKKNHSFYARFVVVHLYNIYIAYAYTSTECKEDLIWLSVSPIEGCACVHWKWRRTAVLFDTDRFRIFSTDLSLNAHTHTHLIIGILCNNKRMTHYEINWCKTGRQAYKCANKHWLLAILQYSFYTYIVYIFDCIMK